ncbi:VOC family protein [Flagellimonas meridianipacifica]|uniref:Catechol 2,3-dioxygenase-like lactoylglutathione lyase family enzyme n=1 Tax=Flagellimonas meridianipacifica TaxID=1080225 RepID=A0A2T0MI75_9FLAO|nr:VOC family protein [Allomuricauda pacifica]PRX57284.1 catechol 2,3-dioxygenase-like lactoylglutathione lyase family enzyme [Allomuricauda pacifica]
MGQNIGLLTLVVSEYDEAIEFYTQKMGFDLIEDTVLSEDKRWVVVKPKGSKGSGLLLAKVANPLQEKSVGNQTGGRVFLFLNTDDFWRDYKIMIEKGITFLEEPREEAYGTVSVFEDLYGNKWDLLELKK